MNEYQRFGVYMVPEGDLYAQGAAWLGWDSVRGEALEHPMLPGLPVPPRDLTATPRKYGLHGTIKPPFRLAEGHDADALATAVEQFCAGATPVTLPALTLRRLGRFLALVPEAPVAALSDLAAGAVEALDPFRAPLTEAELAKRRKARLTDRQEALLQQWGYPYVMAEFRFHITLTGALRPNDLDATEAALAAHFASVLSGPVPIRDLALMGEDGAGMFHLIHRYALTG